ncbi:MAG: NAD-dependent epimerase [Cyclobacteriaceae bacterium]|nr:NAD-dependent epimerase [Cyclobacteriaceae bacterium]
MSSTRILVTGAAGFIGFHLSKRLLESGYLVIGLDNLNDYYDVTLKESRLSILKELPGFSFHKINLEDKDRIDSLFSTGKFDFVVNLAAQAGVRYSLQNPYAYLNSNLTGFLNILEACRNYPVKHLVYASSSSVYGANRKMPFSVHDNVDHPLALYAVSKKANELMAHSYSNLYNIPTTGLRFFTVYGPYGRPDMALFLFTKAILEGRPIDVFNNGEMLRDFTYVDDIVEGIVRLIPNIPKGNPDWNGVKPDPATSFAPYRIYNIGNNKPVQLLHFIEVLEQKLGKTAVKNFLPLQDGDVPATYADVDDLIRDVGFKPGTSIETGISNFVDWYKIYYKI